MGKSGSVLLLMLFLSTLIRAQEIGPDVRAEIERLSASAVKLYQEKKFDEALQPARRALSLSEKSYGDGHELVAVSLNNLAKVYGATGKISDAEKLYRRALAIYEKLLGPDSLNGAAILDSLGYLELVARHDPDGAEALFRRGVEIREKVLGAGHEDTLRSIDNLLAVYYEKGDVAKAEPLLRQVVEAREKALEPADPRLIVALERYACLLRQAKRYTEAAKLEDRAYAPLSDKAGGAQVTLSSGAALCRAITIPLPDQAGLIQRGVVNSGSVSVELVVDESGRVVRSKALSGPTEFRLISEQAAANSRFAPLVTKGKAVSFSTVLTYSFTGLRAYQGSGVTIR